MIFALCMLLFVGVVAFFHYIQGFFSATLSAIIAVIAAVFAVSYHETVVESLLGGKMANQAHALVLLALFALIYLLLRVIFDKAVPGNIRLPVLVDKVGAVVMGLVAGIFGVGVLTIAAQELPFRTGVAGYTRYPVDDEHKVQVPTGGRSQDSATWEQIKSSEPGKMGEQGEEQSMPILGIDQIVVSMVDRLSSPTGALQNNKPFESIHPDFLTELFGERLGIEPNAGHVVVTSAGHSDAAKLLGVFVGDTATLSANEADPEFKTVRGPALKLPVKPNNSQEFVIVRVLFNRYAADPDGIVRLSPGSVRLVTVTPGALPGDMPQYHDNFPVGTLDDGKKLWVNRIDDFLYVSVNEGDTAADFVFVLDKKALGSDGLGPAPEGTFIAVKRMARLDLSGQKLKPWAPPEKGIKVEVQRKPQVAHPPQEENNDNNNPSPPPAPPPSSSTPSPSPSSTGQPPPAQPAAQKSFDFKSAEASANIPVKITINAGDESKTIVPVPGGTVAMKEQKVSTANVDSPTADQNLANQLKEFFVPPDMAMVQVHGAPAAGSKWTAAQEPEQLELADSDGKKYQPFGIYAAYKAGGADHILLKYTSGNQIPGVSPPDGADAPGDLVLIYLVPQQASIVGFYDHGTKVKDLQIKPAK